MNKNLKLSLIVLVAILAIIGLLYWLKPEWFKEYYQMVDGTFQAMQSLNKFKKEHPCADCDCRFPMMLNTFECQSCCK